MSKTNVLVIELEWTNQKQVFDLYADTHHGDACVSTQVMLSWPQILQNRYIALHSKIGWLAKPFTVNSAWPRDRYNSIQN